MAPALGSPTSGQTSCKLPDFKPQLKDGDKGGGCRPRRYLIMKHRLQHFIDVSLPTSLYHSYIRNNPDFKRLAHYHVCERLILLSLCRIQNPCHLPYSWQSSSSPLLTPVTRTTFPANRSTSPSHCFNAPYWCLLTHSGPGLLWKAPHRPPVTLALADVLKHSLSLLPSITLCTCWTRALGYAFWLLP